MNECFKLKSKPIACNDNIIKGMHFRITLLTSRMVRLEYNSIDNFVDKASQVVLNRDFSKVDYTIEEKKDGLVITTENLIIDYDKKEFSETGLSISVQSNTWHYDSKANYSSMPGNLGGTIKTIDNVNGSCDLGEGLMSFCGYSILDDSDSLLITDNGWIEPRMKKGKDIYFFGYGQDFLNCLKDYYYLTGNTPMLPRFALGNWWSRYYKYTEESYKELIKRFEAESIPFTVAGIDMDWHLVDIDPKYGSGWTGYTWNRSLFPNPERFLKWLHNHGLKVYLNVHPALGIRAHEEMYDEIAKLLKVDYNNEEKIPFDITNQEFLYAYFNLLHHPHEEKGVDFWWIDWQQGTSTKLKGMDPLWMLNHYHFLFSARNGKRPIILSRYAGPGSHRYPVGFSGDSIITWESLNFQPYFTATASNIGYGWWSHDIGGHMKGYCDEQLEARWYQLGVFLPINRLHSSNSEFMGKEPWNFKPEIKQTMAYFLRLRHKMVPYLYTMNYLAWKECLPIVQPMYYRHSKEYVSYIEFQNQYYFGTELMVAPITSPIIKGINRAKISVWLPDELYHDVFTGMVYFGKRQLVMYRGLEYIPVLAKAGAIIPMTDEIKGNEAVQNPKELSLYIYSGANGNFNLYEDDNETMDYEKDICVRTEMKLDGDTFTILPAEGKLKLIPDRRIYKLIFCGCMESSAVVVSGNEKIEIMQSYDKIKSRLTIILPSILIDQKIEVQLIQGFRVKQIDIKNAIKEFLHQAEISYMIKDKIYDMIRKKENTLEILGSVFAIQVENDLFGCLLEMLTAYD